MHHRGTDGRIARWLFVTVLSCVPGAIRDSHGRRGCRPLGVDRHSHLGRDRPGEPAASWPPGHAATDRHGTYADGSVRDLTRALSWTSLDPAVATVSARGQVVPKGNGTATIVARQGSVEVKTTVKVERMDQPAPVSFRRDVIPAFSQAGCNTGACHGTPTGKGGFRLSLRGYLPDQDFLTLSREVGGRRINLLAADSSLLLTKPLGEVAHEGGLRLSRSSKSFEFLRDWIKEGAKDDPQAPAPGQARDPCPSRGCSMRRPRPSSSWSCSTWPTAPSAT